MRKFLLISILLYSARIGLAQSFMGYHVVEEEGVKGTVVNATIQDADTLPLIYLHSLYVVEERVFHSERKQKQYGRLKRHVKKVYPYAKMAGDKLKGYNNQMLAMNDVERKKFMKTVEKELEDEFGNELRDLSITQGRILIKLIDRETGDCSYELVKELRGSFSAFFWQSLARLFGHDLKSNYDPDGEDQMIEEIVMLIENGQI